MTCPGGCIGGGGQPRLTSDEVRKARIAAIYKEDEGKQIRASHYNPEVALLYEKYLKAPLGERSHHLLHTGYTPREPV
jgi:NADP-reducing hydrogenase subunit HndD